MRRVKRNILVGMLLAIITFTGCSGENVASAIIPSTSAEAKEAEDLMGMSTEIDCTIGAAEKYVANELNLTISGSGYGAYRDALVAAQILLPTELTDTSKSITKAELALLAARVMAYKGEKEDSDLSEVIVSKKRISDLSKIDEPYKSCVVQVFGEGVMVGNSNGTYSQSRKFKASESVTTGEMKSAILKALGEKDRSVMSPDGQLTRTTKLPSNYKRFNYILASFPNKFYEMKFMDQRISGTNRPEYYKEYCYPKDMKNCTYDAGYEILQVSEMLKKYSGDWEEKIKKNLTYRLNFDYRTVDSQWVKNLAKTYNVPQGEEVDESRIARINSFVKTAKKNKVVINCSDISVDAGNCYKFLGDFYVRCHAKIKVNADTIYSAESMRQTELIYSSGDLIQLINLKKGQVYDVVFETAIGGAAYGDTGSGFSVSDDWIVDWYKLKGR